MMEPRFEVLKEKILVGKRMDMCFSNLKTYDLWHSFMPVKHFAVMGEKYKKEEADSEEEIWIPVRKL